MTNFYGQFIGFGAGGVAVPGFVPHSATNYGYCAGGGLSNSNVIDRWQLVATANAADVGDLYLEGSGGTSYGNAGASSATHGYSSGGYKGSGGGSNSWNTIDKWSFASATNNATDVGNITLARRYPGGISSELRGYVVGGYQPPGDSNIIDKFDFASDGDSVDHGNMTTARSGNSCQGSETYGYSCYSGTEIQKFAFGSNADASVYSGVLNGGTNTGHGHSSSTHGYISGSSAVLSSGSIDKFSFASEGDATAVGVLTATRGEGACGVSSSTYGYCAGGNGTSIDVIDRFAYASDGDATDVGDLTVARAGGMADAQF